MKMPGIFNLSKVMSQLGDIKTSMKKELADIRKKTEQLENERDKLFSYHLSKDDVLKIVLLNIDRAHCEAIERSKECFSYLGYETVRKDRNGAKIDNFYYSLSSNDSNISWVTRALGSFGFDNAFQFAFLFAHEKLKEVATEIINGLPDDEWKPKSSISAEEAVARISVINTELEELNQRADELLTEAKKAGFSIG
ncbi:hypothetical protein [Pectobacterium sp. IFB5596]|uniref:hypothetical protein n=1 Tax=Pectobacterium sp. IFB5596 TaxID=1839803 RepID=UPI001F3D386E|nr:hypothetical protein [Pectobacterium sp. IFB5596]MCE9733913.1 hypothetical protein [Pectobacterium sp. IFB5596]GKW13528.1 hypothetical protein PEC301899_38100 [Pectobacterium carotovorum subsp. carotovorum]